MATSRRQFLTSEGRGVRHFTPHFTLREICGRLQKDGNEQPAGLRALLEGQELVLLGDVKRGHHDGAEDPGKPA